MRTKIATAVLATLFAAVTGLGIASASLRQDSAGRSSKNGDRLPLDACQVGTEILAECNALSVRTVETRLDGLSILTRTSATNES
ncbi:MAG: hypothetical protein U1E56_09085 [Bauldia sp.]